MGLSPLFARVCSDLHLDACPMDRPQSAPADIALVPGDAFNGHKGAQRVIDGLEALLDEPLIIFVPGNHEGYGCEDWDEMVQSLREASRGSRVRVLHRDVFEHQGRRFVGATLWTNFRYFGLAKIEQCVKAVHWIPDYRSIKTQGRLITPGDTIAWHALDLAFFERALGEPFDGPTIALSHHAPDARSVAPRYAMDLATAAFASRLPEALIERAALWAHGHVHTSYDYPVGRGRVICNPRGYSRESAFSTENFPFNPDLIVAI